LAASFSNRTDVLRGQNHGIGRTVVVTVIHDQLQYIGTGHVDIQLGDFLCWLNQLCSTALWFLRQAPGIRQRITIRIPARLATDQRQLTDEHGLIRARISYRAGVTGVDGHGVRITGDPAVVNHQFDDIKAMAIWSKGRSHTGSVHQASDTAIRSIHHTPLISQLITISVGTGRTIQLQFIVQDTGTVFARIGHRLHVTHHQLHRIWSTVLFTIVNDQLNHVNAVFFDGDLGHYRGRIGQRGNAVRGTEDSPLVSEAIAIRITAAGTVQRQGVTDIVLLIRASIDYRWSVDWNSLPVRVFRVWVFRILFFRVSVTRSWLFWIWIVGARIFRVRVTGTRILRSRVARTWVLRVRITRTGVFWIRITWAWIFWIWITR